MQGPGRETASFPPAVLQINISVVKSESIVLAHDISAAMEKQPKKRRTLQPVIKQLVVIMSHSVA